MTAPPSRKRIETGKELPHERPFTLEADEPPVLPGENAAVNPVEHLLQGFASCLTTSIAYHDAARGIKVEGGECTIESDRGVCVFRILVHCPRI